MAGSDRRRLTELTEALQDKTAKALLFARGGYGTQRLLPTLNGHRISPKVVVGLSDLTVLLNYLWQQHSLPSLYGPLVAPHLGNPINSKRLARALTEPDYFQRQKLTAREILGCRGVLPYAPTRGILVGGCLSLIISTLGTPFECDTVHKILFLEDTQEEPYAVDRMLTQLKQAGKLKQVRGIVLGTFLLKNKLFPAKIKNVVQECLKDFPGPVLWGVRFGHCPDPLIVPIGLPARIEGHQLIIEKGIFS